MRTMLSWRLSYLPQVLALQVIWGGENFIEKKYFLKLGSNIMTNFDGMLAI